MTYNNFMRLRLGVLLLLLVVPFSAHALDLAGRELFIPVAGRTPGAAGTMWETDLVITSHSPEYAKLRVRVDFSTTAPDNTRTFEVDVPSGESVAIEDFARTRFGLQTALGTVRVSTTTPDAQLTAHAIVHNTGGTEPLGQTVQGVPPGALQARSLIGGLMVGGGHRSNVGAANPHGEPVEVSFSAPHGLRPVTVRVPAYGFVQIDASTLRGTEANTISVLVSATRPVYAYGSVIRQGDGDPQFVMPVETRATRTFAVEPACPNPARVSYALAPAPGWIVVFDPGQDVAAVTAQLAARHGFTPRSVYAAIGLGFHAELTPQQIAALQCEPVVDYIEQNAWASTAGAATKADALR